MITGHTPLTPPAFSTDGRGDDDAVRMASVLWRHLESSGRDACDLWRHERGWSLTGTSIFREDAQISHLRYSIECDRAWRTLSGRVHGACGEGIVDLTVAVDDQSRWRVNQQHVPAVDGCVDLDLNFTPSTNLIQLRRLALSVGERVEAPVAWLSFPEFILQPLPQTYRRASVPCYDYHAPTVGYSGLLHVHEMGFVLEYPGLWTAEALVVFEK